MELSESVGYVGYMAYCICLYLYMYVKKPKRGKKIRSIQQFLSELWPLWNMYINGQKMIFFWNYSKNIDIWILRKEQNLYRSELYICKLTATKLSFFTISTSNRGDFPRIIEIALFYISLSFICKFEERYRKTKGLGVL